eukprot:TRINITY_DN5478_c0_g3_i1.p1 TRINITY_DN5478_c0_g3~~TRINITY_DN5478_c0_g3_i1.p1  ORF type:complete len:315 (-),score=50.71 TRINITY_DN5478_c0_g3_i1:61-1005(-)
MIRTGINQKSAILVVMIALTLVHCQLNFVAIGDWGGSSTAPYTSPIQLNVAKQMARVAQDINSSFVVGIGDNFYNSGIPTNANDARFVHTFDNVYNQTSLYTPWYLIQGNHDHKGNTTAQIERTLISERWTMPHYWYTVTYRIPNTNKTVEILYFDTVYWSEWYFHPMIYKQQKDWLKHQLHHSSADWLFVVGHYPVYSVASHGPTSILIKEVKPLLEKYKVAAYFSGHDHNLQHLSHNSVEYYLSGCGAKLSHSTKHQKDVPENSIKFVYPKPDDTEGGFISVSVQDTVMVVTYYDGLGNRLYSHKKTNPRST